MAVAVSQPVAPLASTSQAGTYAFGSFTPTANSILVCLAAATGSNTTPGGMVNSSGTALAWNSLPLTNRFFNASSVDALYAHWAIVPSSTAASVYAVDITGDNGTGCMGLMFQVTGAASTSINPIRQFTSTVRTTTATNATVTFNAACLTTSAILLGWFGQLAAGSSTPPTNYTEPATPSAMDAAYTTPAANGAGAFRAGGETGTTFAFTNATTIWGSIGVEVYETGPQDAAYPGCGYYGYP